ncbi:MAG: hypothetical protein WA709_04255 [Stellaceae bacterium]
MADDLSSQFGNILNLLSAAAALGTASMGLVDASKAWDGGPSNFGFGHIRRALDPFLVAEAGPAPAVGGAAAADQAPVFGKAQILETLKANWLNGVPKADQKAKAKALIHLTLTQGNAPALAAAANVNATLLGSLATKTAKGEGEQATQEELTVLGQFDAVLMAVLDVAYERGDQLYRNGSKAAAMVVSTVLAIFSGWVIQHGHGWAYFLSADFGLAAIVGIAATPLAPVAKDLASSLQAAAGAVRLVRRS